MVDKRSGKLAFMIVKSASSPKTGVVPASSKKRESDQRLRKLLAADKKLRNEVIRRREAVTALGGKFDVTSSPKRGTTIHAKFPFNAAAGDGSDAEQP